MVEEFQHENSSKSQLEEEGNVYWIKRRSPDVTLLYVTVPIAAGILLMVLVFFLWIFSSKPESLVQDQFQYERKFSTSQNLQMENYCPVVETHR